MGLSQDKDLKASEEAAVWLQRLREQETPELRAEFSAWIRKGATNLEEFLFSQAIWKEMDHIDEGMRERLWSAEASDAVVALPPRDSLKVRDAWREAEKAPRLRRAWLASAAAIVALAVLGWAAVALFDSRADVYVTALGEQKSVQLGDGSIMHLNTSSR